MSRRTTQPSRTPSSASKATSGTLARVLSSHPALRPWLVPLLAVVLVAAVVASPAYVIVAGGHPESQTMTVLDLSSASPETRTAYRLASERSDLFAQMPCYCGCAVLDVPPRSLKDCFINPDGSPDSHANGCRVCVSIALDVEAAFQAGKTPSEIRASIDAKYTGTGPATDTPFPPD